MGCLVDKYVVGNGVGGLCMIESSVVLCSDDGGGVVCAVALVSNAAFITTMVEAEDSKKTLVADDFWRLQQLN